MKCVIVLLSVLSLGHSAPLSGCESLLQPITISNEDGLGRWHYIAASSDVPGSRSLGRLLGSVVLDITPTSQSNIVNVLQTQKIKFVKCSSLSYNVIFENSSMIIEEPFFLKDIFLPTDCSDCLVVYEEIVTGKDSFTSLILFSRSRTVSPVTMEALKKQAECLRMPSPIMTDPNMEMCPDGISHSDGIEGFNSLLKSRMGHRVARLLDSVFDLFG
ncbi:unnamed protein product [Ophioblennius macclurei]